MCLKTYMGRLPLGEAGPKGLKGQGWNPGGHRPPFGQPSLDREGVDEVDGWDDLCLFAHVRKKLIHHFKHQSSPLPSASPLSRVDFRIRRPEAAFSLAPSHRCRGVPEREPSGLPFSSFFPSTFRQSVSYVPATIVQPPARLARCPPGQEGR